MSAPARALTLPVIMLTAMPDHTDRVVGLEIGADDRRAAPFEQRELMARVPGGAEARGTQGMQLAARLSS
ncbi:hypothetical protein KGY14_08080 [Ameyamaea chiangmaiensis]|uniref:hypothetical protein n=1 Tax=Ameyamaea chiangmaiensis TaxID=442969 RepID=UPI001BAEF17D|nr:hypothetical protein [Ameyamaea chiangmaiensis]MBS4075148.1 hypothetical protein [Ameyamaea chiangmaiensis]